MSYSLHSPLICHQKTQKETSNWLDFYMETCANEWKYLNPKLDTHKYINIYIYIYILLLTTCLHSIYCLYVFRRFSNEATPLPITLLARQWLDCIFEQWDSFSRSYFSIFRQFLLDLFCSLLFSHQLVSSYPFIP